MFWSSIISSLFVIEAQILIDYSEIAMFNTNF